MLPIHPSWILAVGLLGRYSNRRNQSGLSRREALTYRIGTSRWGTEVLLPSRNLDPTFPPRHSGARIVRARHQVPSDTEEDIDQDWADVGTLYGTTGSFEFPTTTTTPDGPPFAS